MSSAVFDETAEMRAMILVALPFPPMPVYASKLEADSSQVAQDRVIISSHDVLSNLLLSAMHGRMNSHTERRERQRMVLKSFLKVLLTQENPSVADLHQLYCTATRLHIGTFFAKDKAPPIEFVPLSNAAPRGCVVHQQMCDYMAGQARLLEESGRLCAQDWHDLEYPYMLHLCARRLATEHMSVNADADVDDSERRENGIAQKLAVVSESAENSEVTA
jgi:hypothetical protein